MTYEQQKSGQGRKIILKKSKQHFLKPEKRTLVNLLFENKINSKY
jgi:hypothetical protein